MARWCTGTKSLTCIVGGLILGSLIDTLAFPIGSRTWEWLVTSGVAMFILIIAPWNATAKILAYFGGTALVSGSVFLFDAISFALQHFEWGLVGIWAIMPLAYIFAPLGCVAGTEQLLIKRAIGPIRIPYEEILSVEVKEKVEFLPIKVWAVSGIFAFYGTFIVKGEGRVKAYITNVAVPLVRIQTTRRIFYLSLAEPDDFVKTVKEYLV
jgi:hypothetical protein